MLAPREIDEYLLPTERRVIRVRQHWAYMFNTVLQTALFLLLMVVGAALPRRRACSSTTSRSTWRWSRSLRFTVLTILWWIERIVITDKRVMLAEGFIVHKVGMMPLTKVTDLTFERSIGGRLLGYGTLIVESGGPDPGAQPHRLHAAPGGGLRGAVGAGVRREGQDPRHRAAGPTAVAALITDMF